MPFTHSNWIPTAEIEAYAGGNSITTQDDAGQDVQWVILLRTLDTRRTCVTQGIPHVWCTVVLDTFPRTGAAI